MRLADTYLLVLACALFGYAVLGRGFAYLGVPPAYVGEICLALGIVVFLRSRCSLVSLLTTVPACLLAVIMLWVLLRTLPFVGLYGVDALRDSVSVIYGSFSFIIIGLLLQDARRINTLLGYYVRFSGLLVPLAPLLLVISRYFINSIPVVPGTKVPIVQVQVTETVAHVVGAATFALIGFRVAQPFWMIALLASAVMIGAVSRGAMLAEIIPIGVAVMMLGRWRDLMRAIAVGIGLFCLAYTVEPLLFDYVEPASSEERPISTRQVVENVLSIAGSGGEQTEGTQAWRLDWWKMIVADTVFGPYFWAGRGFGLNIAIADGFSDWNGNSDRPPLRSPHNIQMMLLARAGVPGLVLWLCFVVSWFTMMTRTAILAGRHAHRDWAGLFVFIGCYVGSAIIDASFDPVLESPMLGIWFWCLIGFGIGSVMVYRHRLTGLADTGPQASGGVPT